MKTKKKAKCALCLYSEPIQVKPGDPAIIHCPILNRKFVADAIRICNSYKDAL